MSARVYDQIGNRLTETRDGAMDTYSYLTNAGGGNTPTLDQVALAVGGTRDFTYGPAGHLEEVAAGANVIDFASDAEGRLATTGRDVADVAAGFLYDGRSFLTQAVESTGDPPAEAASVESVYDSSGLLHVLRRRPSPSDPEELVLHVYLAGRSVAQLAIAGDGTETWTYLTTDHLGTPLLATDDVAFLVWEGGFEPFGKDYQEGTPTGALANRLLLRLPGQWDESTWQDATSGASVYYNVHRWYQPGTGSYSRPDPLGLNNLRDHVYLYAHGNPLLLVDPLGLAAKLCCRLLNNFIAGNIAGKRHCYMVADDGTVYGLYPQKVAGRDLGVPRTYDPRDVGGSCKECPCDDSGQQNQCLELEAQNYPIGTYKRLGPNSNTFAGTLADACCKGGIPDGFDDAPGLTDDAPQDTGLRPVPSKPR